MYQRIFHLLQPQEAAVSLVKTQASLLQHISSFTLFFPPSLELCVSEVWLIWLFSPPGYKPAFPLPCFVGWQLFQWWRVPAPHLPVVPHLRPLHALRLHPCAGLLRPPSGLPCSLPPGGQGARQVWKTLSCCVLLMQHIVYYGGIYMFAWNNISFNLKMQI